VNKPLSPSAMMVLRGLARGLTTCRQLADAGNTSKQGIAWHIAKLQCAGLIRHTRNTHMNPFRYYLTERGEAALQEQEEDILP